MPSYTNSRAGSLWGRETPGSWGQLALLGPCVTYLWAAADLRTYKAMSETSRALRRSARHPDHGPCVRWYYKMPETWVSHQAPVRQVAWSNCYCDILPSVIALQFAPCTGLRILALDYRGDRSMPVPAPIDVGGFTALRSLTDLAIRSHYGRMLSGVQGLGKLSSLTALSLGHVRVTDLPRPPALRILQVSARQRLTDMDAKHLAQLNVPSLDLSGCALAPSLLPTVLGCRVVETLCIMRPDPEARRPTDLEEPWLCLAWPPEPTDYEHINEEPIVWSLISRATLRHLVIPAYLADRLSRQVRHLPSHGPP